ncbi:hypothetical protein JXA32_02440 [Candidatus Sumerlaeota bacterium]|nr:hypothetical protein [Candidatus Sumerlaeota bacterium]
MMKRACLMLLLLTAGIVTLSTGCSKVDYGIIWDPDTSINIVRPSSSWPGEFELTPAQQRLLEAHGQPSLERIWYDPAGEVKRYVEVRDQLDVKTPADFKRSWIYLDLDKEYEFVSPTNYIAHPLTDKIKTLCRYGDPQDFGDGKLQDVPFIEWVYYNRGERYKFDENGALLIKETFQPLHNFIPY